MEIWDNSTGLPQNAVYALEKDNSGFLWIATEEGLVRMDGSIPKVFDKENYPEMQEQTYYSFFKAKSGIWASSDNSIAHLEKTITKVIDCSRITENNWIRGISENEDGEILIGTQKGKIYIWKNKDFKALEFWNPEPFLEIHGFFNLENGKLLVGTNQGLYEIDFRSEKANLISSKDFSADRIFGNLSAIYISSLESGIYRLKRDFEMEKILSYQDVKDINPVSLTTDSDNRIWAGSIEMGLIMIENGIVKRFNYPELKNFTIRKIIKEDGNLFLGTLGKGLAIVKPAKVKQVNFEKIGRAHV
jgi:ligand-binding sensor domain-containing protein